ncbi:MAG: DedA family protein [Alphaproteobacteria bacterium]|nr:DedA family protein [Alphaproteobacteria bacterium]
MQHVLELIRQHGDWFYLLTFVWTALEGETFVIFAALAAQHGLLNIGALFSAAWMGSFLGDQVFFFLGRRFGTRIIRRFPRLQPKLDKAFSLLEKYATVYILSYRFMYGIRNISGIAIGMSRLPWRRFALLNIIASFVWAFAFCGAGYLFGDVIEHLGRRKEEVVDYSVREFMLAALGIFSLIIISRLAVLYWQRRKVEKEIEVDLTVGPDLPPDL